MSFGGPNNVMQTMRDKLMPRAPASGAATGGSVGGITGGLNQLLSGDRGSSGFGQLHQPVIRQHQPMPPGFLQSIIQRNKQAQSQMPPVDPNARDPRTGLHPSVIPFNPNAGRAPQPVPGSNFLENYKQDVAAGYDPRREFHTNGGFQRHLANQPLPVLRAGPPPAAQPQPQPQPPANPYAPNPGHWDPSKRTPSPGFQMPNLGGLLGQIGQMPQFHQSILGQPQQWAQPRQPMQPPATMPTMQQPQGRSPLMGYYG